MRFHSFILATCAVMANWSTASADQTQAIRLNTANSQEFSGIDGVDAALASRIVGLREERGSLTSVEALRILNISPDTLDQIRKDVVIDLPIGSKKGKSYTSVNQVLAEFGGEPEIRAVQAMAMGYTKTNPELVEGWLNASQKAYLLPKLNLQYEKEMDLSEDYEYTTGDDGSAESELDQVDASNDDKYVVKLEWRLDKLVMSSEKIRVINEAQDIVKLRDKVLDEVTRLYFDRRRLQVEMLLRPANDLQAKMKSELRLQELTANLDAYTGGAFSAAVD